MEMEMGMGFARGRAEIGVCKRWWAEDEGHVVNQVCRRWGRGLVKKMG